MDEVTIKLVTIAFAFAIIDFGIGYKIGKSAWQSNKAKALEIAAKNNKK